MIQTNWKVFRNLQHVLANNNYIQILDSRPPSFWLLLWNFQQHWIANANKLNSQRDVKFNFNKHTIHRWQICEFKNLLILTLLIWVFLIQTFYHTFMAYPFLRTFKFTHNCGGFINKLNHSVHDKIFLRKMFTWECITSDNGSCDVAWNSLNNN